MKCGLLAHYLQKISFCEGGGQKHIKQTCDFDAHIFFSFTDGKTII